MFGVQHWLYGEVIAFQLWVCLVFDDVLRTAIKFEKAMFDLAQQFDI